MSITVFSLTYMNQLSIVIQVSLLVSGIYFLIYLYNRTNRTNPKVTLKCTTQIYFSSGQGVSTLFSGDQNHPH